MKIFFQSRCRNIKLTLVSLYLSSQSFFILGPIQAATITASKMVNSSISSAKFMNETPPEIPLFRTNNPSLTIKKVKTTPSQTIIYGTHTLLPRKVNQYMLNAFLHVDTFYRQPNAFYSLKKDGTFILTLPVSTGIADRAIILLHPKNADPTWNTSQCSLEYCRGSADEKYKVNLPVNASELTAYAAVYFHSPHVTSSNLQIKALQGMMSQMPVTGKRYPPGYLIRSYRDLEGASLYDQALAVIAFCLAQEKASAEKILNAMAHLQDSSGAWQFTYLMDGEKAEPSSDKRIAGANAWMALALDMYQKTFRSNAYQDVSRASHDYLLSQITPFSYGNSRLSGIRFSATDFTPEKTKVYGLEHQLDAYAALTHYFNLNGGLPYQQGAQKIQTMIEQLLWNGSRFLAGYDASTQSLNTSEDYLDTYTWSLLALGNEGSRGQLFANVAPKLCQFFSSTGKLIYSSKQITRISGFYEVILSGRLVPLNKQFVWSEGTLGAILAMQQAKKAGVNVSCNGLKPENLLDVQNVIVDNFGGAPYATWNDNPNFTSSASVAGTVWLYFANQLFNPFTFQTMKP